MSPPVCVTTGAETGRRERQGGRCGGDERQPDPIAGPAPGAVDGLLVDGCVVVAPRRFPGHVPRPADR